MGPNNREISLKQIKLNLASEKKNRTENVKKTVIKYEFVLLTSVTLLAQEEKYLVMSESIFSKF